ncbi:MAG: hypothetical protein ACYTFI_01990 [Planctomycetota bacterium]
MSGQRENCRDSDDPAGQPQPARRREHPLISAWPILVVLLVVGAVLTFGLLLVGASPGKAFGTTFAVAAFGILTLFLLRLPSWLSERPEQGRKHRGVMWFLGTALLFPATGIPMYLLWMLAGEHEVDARNLALGTALLTVGLLFPLHEGWRRLTEEEPAGTIDDETEYRDDGDRGSDAQSNGDVEKARNAGSTRPTRRTSL